MATNTWKQVEREVASLLGNPGGRVGPQGGRGQDVYCDPPWYVDAKHGAQVPRKMIDIYESAINDMPDGVIGMVAVGDDQAVNRGVQGAVMVRLCDLNAMRQPLTCQTAIVNRRDDYTLPRIACDWLTHIESTCPADRVPVIATHRPRQRYNAMVAVLRLDQIMPWASGASYKPTRRFAMYTLRHQRIITRLLDTGEIMPWFAMTDYGTPQVQVELVDSELHWNNLPSVGAMAALLSANLHYTDHIVRAVADAYRKTAYWSVMQRVFTSRRLPEINR